MLCGVAWCGVVKGLLPNCNGPHALHTGNVKLEGCVCDRMMRVVYYALAMG